MVSKNIGKKFFGVGGGCFSFWRSFFGARVVFVLFFARVGVFCALICAVKNEKNEI